MLFFWFGLLENRYICDKFFRLIGKLHAAPKSGRETDLFKKSLLSLHLLETRQVGSFLLKLSGRLHFSAGDGPETDLFKKSYLWFDVLKTQFILLK